MVTEYGMSSLGPQQLGRTSGEPFLGRDMGHEANYSDQVAADIDAEVARLLDEAHVEAAEILSLHRSTLDRLADALVEHETLGDPELQAILGHLDTWSGRASEAGSGRGVPPVVRGPATSNPAANREPVTSAEADRRSEPGESGPPTFGGPR
jgi:cell division protease FtsH